MVKTKVDAVAEIFKSDERKKQDAEARLAHEQWLAEEAKKTQDIDAFNRLADVVMESCENGIKPHTDAPTLQVDSVKERMHAQGKGLMGSNWPIEKTAGGWRLDVIARDSKGSMNLTCYTDKYGKVIRIVAMQQ